MKKLKIGLIASSLGLLVAGGVAAPLITSCGSTTTTNETVYFNPVLKSKFDLSKFELKTGTNKNDLKPVVSNSNNSLNQSSFNIDDRQRFIINLTNDVQYFALDLSKLKPTDLFDNVDDSSYHLKWLIEIDAQPNNYNINANNNIVKNESPINQASTYTQLTLKLKLTISNNNGQNDSNSFWFIVNKQGQNTQKPQPGIPPETELPPNNGNDQNNNQGNNQPNKPLNVAQAKPEFESENGLSVSNKNCKFDKEVPYSSLYVDNAENKKPMSSDVSTAINQIFINTNSFYGLNREVLFPYESQFWGVAQVDITAYIPTDVNPDNPNIILYINLYHDENQNSIDKPNVKPTKTTWCFSIIGFNNASLKNNYDVYLSNLIDNMTKYLDARYLTVKSTKPLSNINTNDILAFDNNKIEKLLKASIWSLNNVLLNKRVIGSSNKSLILTKEQINNINETSFEFKTKSYQPDSLSLKDPINLYSDIDLKNINQLTINFKDPSYNAPLTINNWFVLNNNASIIDESNILTKLQTSINNVYKMIKSKIDNQNASITTDSKKYKFTQEISVVSNLTNPFNDSIISNQILNSDFILKKLGSSTYDFQYKISNYLIWYSFINLLANNNVFSENIKSNLLNFDIVNNHLVVKYNNKSSQTDVILNKKASNEVDDIQTLTDKIINLVNDNLKDKTIKLSKNTLQADKSNFNINENIKLSLGTGINLQDWMNNLIKPLLPTNYVLLNKQPCLIDNINYTFYLNEYNECHLQIDFTLTDIINNVPKSPSIYKPIKLNISLDETTLTKKTTNINLKQPSFKIDDLYDNINSNREKSVNYFLDLYDNDKLIDFVYKSRFILFDNPSQLTKDMIESAQLKYVDNINPSRPELNLSIKLKNQSQTLIAKITNFNDASLQTNYQYYFLSFENYINNLVRNSARVIDKYIDSSNNLDANKLYNIWTNHSFNNQIYLSSNKSFDLMNNNDYIKTINEAISRIDPNLNFDKLINNFNNSYIHSSSINIESQDDFSIILTQEQKQQLNANAFKFSKTTKNLSSINYDNGLYIEESYDLKLKSLISDWKLSRNVSYLTISFNKATSNNANVGTYVSNYLIEYNSQQLDVNQYLSYTTQLINKMISDYLSGFSDVININIPNSLSLDQQNSWITSSIFATKWKTANWNTFSIRDFLLMSNFILHIYNYSLPANFDFSKLGFTINNKNQLNIQYDNGALNTINLKIQLDGWNTINKNDYLNDFQTSINSMLANQQIGLSQYELNTIPEFYASDEGYIYLKSIYIIDQIYNSLNFDAKVKVNAINSSYSLLLKNYNYYDYFLKYNPIVTTFNYELANKKTGFVNFTDKIQINNKTINLKTTSNIWSNVDGINNDIGFTKNPLIFDYKNSKISVSTIFAQVLNKNSTSLNNLKVNLSK